MTGGLATASFYNVAIVVSSIDRAVEWYGRIFGFVEQARGPIAEGTVALMNGCGLTVEVPHRDRPADVGERASAGAPDARSAAGDHHAARQGHVRS